MITTIIIQPKVHKDIIVISKKLPEVKKEYRNTLKIAMSKKIDNKTYSVRIVNNSDKPQNIEIKVFEAPAEELKHRNQSI